MPVGTRNCQTWFVCKAALFINLINNQFELGQFGRLAGLSGY